MDSKDEDALVPGTPIGDRYVIGQQLGRGGFAVVYVARHRFIDNLRVAIKILRAEHAESETSRRRFLREAQAVAALRTRHVVRVTDAGEFGDKRPYLVMELCEGQTLDEVLDRRGTIGAWDTARLSIQILLAIEEAHAAGIVHRDLKPSNVFVVHDSHEKHPIAKVGDFGIARITDGATQLPPSMTMSANGGIVCTPLYAAPELLDGNPSTLSDIYALGHMMAELLDGVPPYAFRKQPLLVCASHLGPEPVPLGARARSSPLAGIIERAVRKDPSERWQTAAEMREALVSVFAGMAEPEFPLKVVLRSWERPTTAQMQPVSDREAGIAETIDGPAAADAAVTALAATIDAPGPEGRVAEGATSSLASPGPGDSDVPVERRRRSIVRALMLVGGAALVVGLGLVAFGTLREDAPTTAESATPSRRATEASELPTALPNEGSGPAAAEVSAAQAVPSAAQGGEGSAAAHTDATGTAAAADSSVPQPDVLLDQGRVTVVEGSSAPAPPIETPAATAERADTGPAREPRRRSARRGDDSEEVGVPSTGEADAAQSPFDNLRAR